ncbi:agamous-like MADS-box protein AGL80 [Vitis riparia]|uniref:agamous-like MADS-box protein AGL80 n=1 Tax=Vitis riparia TaxID=96939 RepID=UPI00155B24EB|nr:agamous-like MADS-box protein AGL80 [Vitis riparia]
MARKKVKLQWIVDNAARKATYKKRVKGLMKKVRDLSILCGVDACVITYSPYHPEPQVWPSPIEVEQVIAAFRSRPENDQTKKVMNQENFTWQRIFKARDEVLKQQMKNRKKEIENLRIQCLGGRLLEGLESKDLLDLTWAIDNQLEAVKNRTVLVPWPQVAADARGSANNTGTGIGDVPAVGAFTSIDAVSHVGSASGVPLSVIGAVGGTNAAAAQTSFDLAIDAPNNPLIREQNQNQNMGNALGDPLDYDVYDFWRNPYIL